MSSHDLGFDERDLAEATRLPKDKPSFGVVAGFVVAVVLFLALLVHGSLPDAGRNRRDGRLRRRAADPTYF